MRGECLLEGMLGDKKVHRSLYDMKNHGTPAPCVRYAAVHLVDLLIARPTLNFLCELTA